MQKVPRKKKDNRALCNLRNNKLEFYTSPACQQADGFRGFSHPVGSFSPVPHGTGALSALATGLRLRGGSPVLQRRWILLLLQQQETYVKSKL